MRIMHPEVVGLVFASLVLQDGAMANRREYVADPDFGGKDVGLGMRGLTTSLSFEIHENFGVYTVAIIQYSR